MTAARRRLVLTASLALASAATVASTGAAASAAPVDFTPGQKYDAICDGTLVSVEPVNGAGAWTPYWVNGKERQLLVPTSLTLTGDAGLKARHLLPGTTLTKPGTAPTAGETTCVITGYVRQTDVSYAFSLVVTGQLR
jgi:hypothetical protein